MYNRRPIRIAITAIALCLAIQACLAKPQTGSQAPPAGQTTTLLPNGGWLLVGGQDASGDPVGTLSVRNAQGDEEQLATSLRFPRIWHSATVLPDGTVLILGGIGADGQIVQQAEIFNPETQQTELIASSAPVSRAFHSATILTDGRLLIAGGVGADGTPLLTAELWDPRHKSSAASVNGLGTARRNHSATLLPDGRVLLSGGEDATGKPYVSGEVYDPKSQVFTPVADLRPWLVPPTEIGEVKAASPEDGATDVAVTALISMRFSRPLRIETINNGTVLLEGPIGMVDANVVGAEGGMLAFITPKSVLLPGTVYSVKFSGAADDNNLTAAFMQFSFTTAGEPPASDVWVPGIGWTCNCPTSTWQAMPSLQAGAGVTALAGQVLKLDGTPLKHVTLMIGDRKAFTDATGRFLLTNIPAGHSTMTILGNTANTSTRTYGIYEVGVDVKPNTTNVLRYIIWMTPLDTAHAVKIPSPTTTEMVITTPLLPGLELRLPPNTVVTDYYGRPVTEISITPIPIDRPPFPLPNVQVPLYFTIQPGSAYIKVMSSSGPKGARLFYPNATDAPAGTVFNFWNYDPDKKGWYVYGQGRVSADRSQVIPNAGVEIYEFTGAMVESPGGLPSFGPPPHDGGSGGGGSGGGSGSGSSGGDPVDLATGLFVYQKTDLALPDVIPIMLTRTYRQGDSVSRAFGIGTSFAYDMFTVGDNVNYTYQDLILADGGRVHFPHTPPCNPSCGFFGATYQHTSTPSSWFGAIIHQGGICLTGVNAGFWTLTTKDGTIFCFPDSSSSTNPRAAAVTWIQDRHGNILRLTRDVNANLTQITTSNGRWIQLTYDASNRITQAKDNIGRIVTYSYDAGGRLTRVVDANGGVWNYAYDAFNQMLSIQDPRGIFYLTNQYDASGRVVHQTQADNTVFSFSYTTDPTTGQITQTDFTDACGFVRRTTYNANGYKTAETFALARPEQQAITYNRDSNTNLVSTITDALSRQTLFAYDSMGNTTNVTQLAGTQNAVTTMLTYDSTFNQLNSITDPLGHATALSRDRFGNLAGLTDPLGHQTTFTYNSQGLPLTATDGVRNTAQFAYSGGDLVSITDALGNSTSRFVDDAGRPIAITDALGRTTRASYNALGEILHITDPLQAVTAFSYDVNGNLASLTEPLNHTTAWNYDNLDRVITRTDPLLRSERSTYDSAGNLLSFTDRKGQVTSYSYDALNRLTFVGFGKVAGSPPAYQSTINFSYDSGNRLTQAADSVAGTITRAYDGLDRLTSETTPQGAISYSYDAAGRRMSMTVTGQPAVNYTWDNANRPTQIAQASTTVAFAYDDAGRRSALTLPNGITVQYGYDQASRLTALTYMLGTNTLGNLTYSFDAANDLVQMGGSFARTKLPQAIVSASYDTANQLTNWNGVSFAYDANGNLLSDGANSYVWNARDQLASFNAASFQYDAFARRTQNVVGTNFLYDGVNAVQELNGTIPTANLLSGGIDQIFSRTDSSGISSFLPDFLGSTVALADSSGLLQTLYSYEPFGNATATGNSSSNVFQYSGRENDGTGMFYYRARYYSPTMQRFISEDPIGFWGGVNKYVYVGDNPVLYRDPFGLDKSDPHHCGDPNQTLRQIQRSAFNNVVVPWSDAAGGPNIETGMPSVPGGPLSPPSELPKKTLQSATDWYGASKSAQDLYNTYKGTNRFMNDFSNGMNDIMKSAGNCGQ